MITIQQTIFYILKSIAYFLYKEGENGTKIGAFLESRVLAFFVNVIDENYDWQEMEFKFEQRTWWNMQSHKIHHKDYTT